MIIYPSEADVISFCRSVTQSLQPYAQSNGVLISFSSRLTKQVLSYQPLLLSQSITQLLCNIINILPSGCKIKVRILRDKDKKNLNIEVENTGMNLVRITEVSAQCPYPFVAFSLAHGTLYRLALSMVKGAPANNEIKQLIICSNSVTPFYSEIRKRLHSHFTRADKLIATLSLNCPHEAAFMQKINALIRVNLEDERFDANALSEAMCISRTQLFRRLKSLIKQAPANYIRVLRLQRAKQLLETTDLTISEIVYKSGFQTVSHFAKIFRKQYGIQPSVFRNQNKHATNG